MLETIKKLNFILSTSHKKKILFLLTLLIITVFFDMIGIGLLYPVIGLINGGTIDSFINLDFLFKILPKDFNYEINISILLIFLLSIYILKTLVTLLSAWFETKLIARLHQDISKRLFSKYLHQDYLFFLNKNSTKLIQNLTNELDKLLTGFLSSFFYFITDLLIIAGISIILITIHPKGFLLILFFFGTIGLVFLLLTKNQIGKLAIQRNITQSFILKNLAQSFRSIKDIVVLGKQVMFIEYLNKLVKGLSSSIQKISFLRMLPKQFLELSVIILFFLAINYLIIINYDLRSIIPIAGVFLAGAIKILPSLNRIISHYTNMSFCAISINLIYKELILKNKNFIKNQNTDKKIGFNKYIEFKNISFSYPNNSKKIFQNVNFKIKRNSIVGLVGDSGSGKTTFIDIVLGVLKPDTGKIIVDGLDINKDLLSKRMWQNNIGYVPQDSFLLDDTISANIAFGDEIKSYKTDRIKDSLKLAQIWNFTQSLRLKQNSIVGEYGKKISGGQRQRIGLARAFYNNPNLLILDEATNALDSKTEKLILKVIYKMAGKRTILIISHNKKILHKCNSIINFKKGSVKIYKNVNSKTLLN